jgi:putative copper resistance protein D
LIGSAVALALVTGLLLGTLTPSVAILYGLPSPGIATEIALPAGRLLGVLALAAVLARLLVAVVYLPGDPDGLLSAPGYLMVRSIRWWSAVQVVAYLLVGLCLTAENTGLTPGWLLAHPRALAASVGQLEPVIGWGLGAALAAVVGTFSWLTMSWRGAAGLLTGQLAVILPITLTASTNAQRSHDIVGDAVTLHLLAAAVWLASVLGLLLLPDDVRARPEILRRHSSITAVAVPVVGISGVVISAYATAVGDLLTSAYGWFALGSAALLLIGLVIVARRFRPAVGTGRIGVVGLELGVLALAAALGTGLGRVVPPAQVGYETSRLVYLIGYDLPRHLTAIDLATLWRPDLMFAPLALGSAWLYLVGVRRLRRAGQSWPMGYTLSWFAGCAVLLIATSSGLGSYAQAVFSLHMVQHMLLATVAPSLLVLGHGVSLLLASCSPATGRPVTSLLSAPAVRFLRNPFAAWVAVALTLFGLYPTGLYDAVVQQHWAHLGMSVAVFGTGLAVFWAVLGASPGRLALPPIGQLVMIFALMALHAGFSAWLLAQGDPVGEDYYGALEMPFVTDLLADQRLGAILAWALGELPVILTMIVLVVRWARQDETPNWPTGSAPTPLEPVGSAGGPRGAVASGTGREGSGTGQGIGGQ